MQMDRTNEGGERVIERSGRTSDLLAAKQKYSQYDVFALKAVAGDQPHMKNIQKQRA